MQNRCLAGLTREQTVQLLRAPDETVGQGSETLLKWNIGQRPSGGSLMFPYQENMVVTIDSTGNVEKVQIEDHD
jgi:hypothetical protein